MREASSRTPQQRCAVTKRGSQGGQQTGSAQVLPASCSPEGNVFFRIRPQRSPLPPAQTPAQMLSVIRIRQWTEATENRAHRTNEVISVSQAGNRCRQRGRSSTDTITFLSNSAVRKNVDADSSADGFFLFTACLSLHLVTRSSGLWDANNKPNI